MKKTYTRSECKNQILISIICLFAFIYIVFSASQGVFFGTNIEINDSIRIPLVIISILFICYDIYYCSKLQGYLNQMDVLGVDYLTPNQNTNLQTKNRRQRTNTANQQTYNKTLNHQQSHVSNANSYKYYFCPQCGQKLRISSGHGYVKITCPKCQTNFNVES